MGLLDVAYQVGKSLAANTAKKQAASYVSSKAKDLKRKSEPFASSRYPQYEGLSLEKAPEIKAKASVSPVFTSKSELRKSQLIREVESFQEEGPSVFSARTIEPKNDYSARVDAALVDSLTKLGLVDPKKEASQIVLDVPGRAVRSFVNEVFLGVPEALGKYKGEGTKAVTKYGKHVEKSFKPLSSVLESSAGIAGMFTGYGAVSRAVSKVLTKMPKLSVFAKPLAKNASTAERSKRFLFYSGAANLGEEGVDAAIRRLSGQNYTTTDFALGMTLGGVFEGFAHFNTKNLSEIFKKTPKKAKKDLGLKIEEWAESYNRAPVGEELLGIMGQVKAGTTDMRKLFEESGFFKEARTLGYRPKSYNSPMLPSMRDPAKFAQLSNIKGPGAKETGILGELDDMSMRASEKIKEAGKSKIGFGTKLKSELIDRFAAIDNMVKKAQKSGYNVPIDQNPYIAARMFSGNAGKIELALEDFGKIINKPNLDHPDLENYLKLKRFEERAGRGFKNPGKFTADKVSAGLDELRQKVGDDRWAALEEAGKEYYQYMNALLKEAKDSGLISKASFDAVKATNESYAPFKVLKYISDNEAGFSGGKSLNVGANSILKSTKGTEEDIADVLETSVEKIIRTKNIVEKNNVMSKLFNMDGASDIFKPIKDGEAFDKTKFEKLSYFSGGKKKSYLAPIDIGTAVKGLDEKQIDIVTKLAAIPGKTLKTGATTANLSFALPNMIRDLQNAKVFAKNGVSINNLLKGFASSVKHEFLGNTDELYRAWQESGASFSGFQRSLKGNKEVLSELTKKTLGKGKILKAANYANPIKWMEKINNTLEEATRLGVFKTAKEAGMTSLEAAMESRTATLDFSRMGSTMKVANVWVPFLNARTQGLANTVRLFKENPKQAAVRIGTTIMVPSLITEAWNLSDPERKRAYDMVPDYEKNKYFVVSVGTYEDEQGEERPYYIKIPKGDLGQIFGSTTENLIEYAAGARPREFADFSKSMLENISPVGLNPMSSLNPLVRVPAELSANYDYYRKQNIVPYYDEMNLPEGLKSNYRTTDVMKDIGEATGISPAKMEHAVTSLTGGLSKDVLSLTEKSDKYFKPQSKLSQTPLVKRFFGTASVGEAPENKSTLETLEAESKSLAGEKKKTKDLAYKNFYQIRKLYDEGKKAEAQAIIENMDDQTYEQFEKITKKQSTDKLISKIRQSPIKARIPAYLEKMRSLKESGKADEAQAILDQMTDSEYAALLEYTQNN